MANITKTEEHITITMDEYDKEAYNESKDIQSIESIYHDDMFFKDLYIDTISDGSYVVDHNTQKVYMLGSYLLQNPLKFILDTLVEKGEFILYPCDAATTAELLQALSESSEDN